MLRSAMSVRAVAIGTAIAFAAGSVAASPVAAANPEGSLDTTFSGDGKLTLPQGGDASVSDATLMADGRLLITGTWDNPDREVFVIRLTPAGAYDTTFSGDGIWHQSFGANTVGKRVRVQSDGKVVVLGDADNNMLLVRLTVSGSLDTSFAGGAGYLVSALGATGDSNGDGLAITDEGRILVTGELSSSSGTASDAFVARYTGAGVLDAGFGVGGIRTVDLDQYDYLGSVAMASDGKVLAVGATQSNTTTTPLAVRLTTTGALDSTFSGDGTWTGANGYATNVVVDRFDRPVFIGFGTGPVLVRLTTTGAADTTFSDDAVVPVSGSPYVLTTQANGRILVAGRDANQQLIQRLDEWGDIDASFGTGGSSTTAITDGATPAAVHVDARARIIVVGTGSFGGTDFQPYVTRHVGDATSPFDARMTGLPLVSTSSSRTLQWTASDDNSGVETYTVRYRSASYSASTLGSATTWKSSTTSTSASFTGSAGRQYCLQAKATDRAGNAGPYGRRDCVIFPVNDRTLTRSGSWSSLSSSAYYRGTASSSTSAGARLTLTGVKYRRLALVATTCSGCGTVKVYRGSTLLKTISLASSTTKRKVVFTVDVSADIQSGTISIRQASSGKRTIIEGLAVGLY